MLKLFAKTYAVSLAARVAAYLTMAALLALGYFSGFGAQVIAWAPNATPELARIIFWALAGLLFFFFLLVPVINLINWNRDLWAERQELELSAIACLSVGKSIDQPYDVEPQLSRHRLLKDAVRSGSLKFVDMAGEKPNVHTLVSRENLRAYAIATNNSDLLDVVAKWDRINPPKPTTVPPPSPAEKFGSLSRPRDYGLSKDGWILNFNPALATGRKLISFNSDGKIGEGRNQNEWTWSMVGDELEIRRQNGDLQNRFRFDPHGTKFISTNHPAAKGIKDQFIFRDRAVQ
jgi:hypothetical protein